MQIEVTERPWDDADATALRTAQRAEIDARYGPGSEPGPAPTAADVAVFLVAHSGGEPVGCGALRPLDDGSAEIKRMYVIPGMRGSGVSTAVLEALENHAAERGWFTLKLETGPKQPEAIRFYERSGYVRIPNFGHYAGHEDSLCFARELRGRPRSSGVFRPGAPLGLRW
jgi:putative acetyltransferase